MNILKKQALIFYIFLLAGLIVQCLMIAQPCRSFVPDDYEYGRPSTSLPLSSQIFVIDDFEYWDDPYNHGWQCSDYAYPIMGYGVGYGSFSTRFDPTAGNRVLTSCSTCSVFNGFQPYCLANFPFRDTHSNKLQGKKILSYKVKAPFSPELFDHIRCYVLIKTRENEWFWLCYLPIDGQEVINLGNYSSPIPIPGDLVRDPLPCLGYPLGRGVQSSTWHWVIRDIQQDLDQALDGCIVKSPQHLEQVYGILFSGNQYSLDDICLLENKTLYKNRQPYIYNPGPQLCTLFEPFELILHATDPDNDEISFNLQVGGHGANGVPCNNSSFSLVPLGTDFTDTRSYARAALRFIPQVFEDLILSVTVSDHYSSRTTTFSITTVSYPVCNHAPVIQGTGFSKRKSYNVNEHYNFQAKAIDQDNDPLTYQVFLNDLPPYLFEPLVRLTVEPETGLISFFSMIEDAFNITLIVRDGKGAVSQTKRTLSVINRGTWLNHPPLGGGSIKNPYPARAGTPFTLTTSFSDPDGGPLYYTTTLGSITSDGIFSFFTYYPGLYKVSITICDIHGARTSLDFTVDVQPWWSC